MGRHSAEEPGHDELAIPEVLPVLPDDRYRSRPAEGPEPRTVVGDYTEYGRVYDAEDEEAFPRLADREPTYYDDDPTAAHDDLPGRLRERLAAEPEPAPELEEEGKGEPIKRKRLVYKVLKGVGAAAVVGVAVLSVGTLINGDKNPNAPVTTPSLLKGPPVQGEQLGTTAQRHAWVQRQINNGDTNPNNGGVVTTLPVQLHVNTPKGELTVDNPIVVTDGLPESALQASNLSAKGLTSIGEGRIFGRGPGHESTPGHRSYGVYDIDASDIRSVTGWDGKPLSASDLSHLHPVKVEMGWTDTTEGAGVAPGATAPYEEGPNQQVLPPGHGVNGEGGPQQYLVGAMSGPAAPKA